MRVLHFLDSLGRGGAEMQALDVCRNASGFGLVITLVAGSGGALESDFRDSGVEFIRLQRKVPIDLYLASQIRKIIKENDIKIVQGYQPVDGLHLYLAMSGLRSVKRVLSFQGFITDRKNRAAAKFLIPRMDANIIVSHGLQKWLLEKDRIDTSKNSAIIYNGADPARLQSTGKSVKKELSLPENTRLIGMVGNFYRDPRKDQLTLCRALPQVFEKHVNVHCILAGGVEPGAEDKVADCLNFCIEKNIMDRIHFLGARNDVPDILSELEVFILSSFYEGLPVAVSEAMLAGVAMILSDIEPHREASENGKYAEIFPVGDADKLSEKILKLLDDNKCRISLAERALHFAEDKFSIKAHLGNLQSLYESLLKSKSP